MRPAAAILIGIGLVVWLRPWEAAEIVTLDPEFTLAAERGRSQYKNQEDLDFYLEGLRKAGVPE